MLSPQDEEFLKLAVNPEINHPGFAHEIIRQLLRIVGELKAELETTFRERNDALAYNSIVAKERDWVREELNKQAEWYERNSTPKF